MNRHMMQVFFYELRRNWSRRGYLFTTFGVPLVAAILLLGYQFIQSRSASTEEPPPEIDFGMEALKNAGYIDETGRFTDPGELATFFTLYPDEAAALDALNNGEIQVYYVIPADYMETGEVTIVMPKISLSLISDAPITALILNTLSEGVDQTLYYRLVDPSNIEQTNRSLVVSDTAGDDAPPVQDEGASFVVVYVFGITLMLSLFVTNGYLLQTVIEEKETRLIEILISTVRPTNLLIGKIFALGILGLVQVVVWIGAMVLIVRLAAGEQLGAVVGVIATLANITIPLNMLPLLLVYFVLAYFLFAGLYGVVGAISNSMKEGPQYAVIFTLPAALPFYFIGLFSTSPDGTIPVIMSLFPLTAPIAMSIRLVVSQVPVEQIVISLVLLALSAIAAMWIAGRAFRINTLLAGSVPKLRDLPKLLRG
ncbi:MAG: ABC transporter permease [Anaerolinea sp.]|nr:ABC transporter permease [Anaerolinea sp.]